MRYTAARLQKHPDGNPTSFSNDLNRFEFAINLASCPSNAKVFVVVVSAAGNFDKRQIVRTTWMTQLANTSWARVVFLVGTGHPEHQDGIEKESGEYGDVIQVNVIDTYDNLVLKTVALLYWARSYCSEVPFVLKCDDDIYVNVFNLATVVRSLPPSSEPAIYGAYNSVEIVNRNFAG